MFNLNKNVNCLKIQYENDALTVMTVNFAKDQHFPKCILHFTPPLNGIKLHNNIQTCGLF